MDRNDHDEADDSQEGTITEKEIDETLEESFPASDPPSWTLGVDPHPHERDDEAK